MATKSDRDPRRGEIQSSDGCQCPPPAEPSRRQRAPGTDRWRNGCGRWWKATAFPMTEGSRLGRMQPRLGAVAGGGTAAGRSQHRILSDPSEERQERLAAAAAGISQSSSSDEPGGKGADTAQKPGGGGCPVPGKEGEGGEGPACPSQPASPARWGGCRGFLRRRRRMDKRMMMMKAGRGL